MHLMCTTEQTGMRTGTAPAHPAPARDLVDFFVRWREFRAIAAGVSGNSCLDAGERETIGWLIALADSVSELDLANTGSEQ